MLKLSFCDEEQSRLTVHLKAIENRGKTTIFPATRMTRRFVCRNQSWRLQVFGLEYYVNLDTWLSQSEVSLSAFRPQCNIKFAYLLCVYFLSILSFVHWITVCYCVTNNNYEAYYMPYFLPRSSYVSPYVQIFSSVLCNKIYMYVLFVCKYFCAKLD